MCLEDDPGEGVGRTDRARPGLSRRALLGGALAVVGTLATGARRPVPAAAGRPVDFDGVEVLPRASWAGGLRPTGPIEREPEVRYLLVHHSVDPGNDYGRDDVAGILRSFFRFHTSPRKGWPDLAYNFLVDRFGRVWEGRTGSLDGPVAGDATGGNQGFDQLCCFVGNHQHEEPSPEAFAAMGRLLGVLAGRYGVALGAGATAVFVSRGSGRHPAGTEVTTATIAGHRDMSFTACPGDRVAGRLPELRLLAAGQAAPVVVSTSTSLAHPRTTPAAPETAAATPTSVTATSEAAPALDVAAPPVPAPAGRPPAPPSPTGGSGSGAGAATAIAAAAAAAAAGAAAIGTAVAGRRGGRTGPDAPAVENRQTG